MSELDRFDAAKPSQLSTGTVHKRPEFAGYRRTECLKIPCMTKSLTI